MVDEGHPVVDAGRRTRRGGVETSVRTSAVWESVEALVAQREHQLGRSLRVVDLGGGTGGLAVPLARLGHHVTVIDPSLDALASLAPLSGHSDLATQLLAVRGDAATLPHFPTRSDAHLACARGPPGF